MTKATICRDAMLPFDMRNNSAKEYHNKDCKLRCAFCDKKFQRKERLDNHQKTCEITCFNFLHKLHFGQTKPVFTNTNIVYWDDMKMPMNEIKVVTDEIIPVVNDNTDTISSDSYVEEFSDEDTEQIIDEFVNNLPTDDNIIDKFLCCIQPETDTTTDTTTDPTTDEDNNEIDNEVNNDIDNEINNENNNNIDNEVNNDTDFEYIYDDDDDLLLEVKKNEDNDIMSYIQNIDNTDLLTFYKCKTKDKYNNTIYLQISNLECNQFLIDIVYDYNDVDFMNWKANNY